MPGTEPRRSWRVGFGERPEPGIFWRGFGLGVHLRFKAQGFGFRAEGLGFRIQIRGFGFRLVWTLSKGTILRTLWQSKRNYHE